jgi:hypothetical protein
MQNFGKQKVSITATCPAKKEETTTGTFVKWAILSLKHDNCGMIHELFSVTIKRQ